MGVGTSTRDVADTTTIEAGVTGAGAMDTQDTSAAADTTGRTLGTDGRWHAVRLHADRGRGRCAGQRKSTAAKKASNRQGDTRPARYLGVLVSHNSTLPAELAS